MRLRGDSESDRTRVASTPVDTCYMPIQPACQRLSIAPGEGLLQVFVNCLLKPAKRSDRAVVVERQQLHHLHGADMFYRVHPELRVENTRPAHAAGAAEALRRRIGGRNLKSQAELVFARSERK